MIASDESSHSEPSLIRHKSRADASNSLCKTVTAWDMLDSDDLQASDDIVGLPTQKPAIIEYCGPSGSYKTAVCY